MFILLFFDDFIKPLTIRLLSIQQYDIIITHKSQL